MLRAALFALSLTLAAAPPARAQPMRMDTDAFVAANLIAIFYHELGHALVDVMRLPIFGQEEDAADVLSILMVHNIFEEHSAREIAWATAMGMKGGLDPDNVDPREIVWWGVHGHDLQRYYTMICLFYGADPARREQFARDLELPEPRARWCHEEFQLADESWGPVLDELYDRGPGDSLRFRIPQRLGLEALLTARIIKSEVDALNAVLSLPDAVDVTIENCGQPNAFYDPNTREIIMCTEFAPYLASVAPR